MHNPSTQRSYEYKIGSGEDTWISMGMRNQIDFINGGVESGMRRSNG